MPNWMPLATNMTPNRILSSQTYLTMTCEGAPTSRDSRAVDMQRSDHSSATQWGEEAVPRSRGSARRCPESVVQLTPEWLTGPYGPCQALAVPGPCAVSTPVVALSFADSRVTTVALTPPSPSHSARAGTSLSVSTWTNSSSSSKGNRAASSSCCCCEVSAGRAKQRKTINPGRGEAWE